jgi:hypothetical protein
VRQKIVNYQALFRNGQYKRYEKIFNVIYSFQGEFSFDRTGFAGGTAISVIPVLIVFFIFQNYFVSGLSGTVKGLRCTWTGQNDDVSHQNTNVAKDIDYGYGYM